MPLFAFRLRINAPGQIAPIMEAKTRRVERTVGALNGPDTLTWPGGASLPFRGAFERSRAGDVVSGTRTRDFDANSCTSGSV